MDFKIGQKYKGYIVNGFVTIRITKIVCALIKFDLIDGTMLTREFNIGSDFAKCLELVTDKPHICDILGNGKPLEVGEVFGFEAGKFLVDEKGLINVVGNGWTSSNRFCDMVNHPEKIIRQPQFSDQEIVGLRVLVMFQFPYLVRDGNGTIFGYRFKPQKSDRYWVGANDSVKLPITLFPQISWTDVEPFYIVGYLEGLK